MSLYELFALYGIMSHDLMASLRDAGQNNLNKQEVRKIS